MFFGHIQRQAHLQEGSPAQIIVVDFLKTLPNDNTLAETLMA